MIIARYWVKSGLTFAVGLVPALAVGTVADAQTGSWWIGMIAGWMAMEVISRPLAHAIHERHPGALLGLR